MSNVGYTPVFEWLQETKARINFLKGGANSSKSYSIAQHLLFNKFYKEKDIRILILRKTTPALRNSCYLLIKDLIGKYNLPQKHNRADLTYEYKNNLILFKGLDDPEKIKSSEFNYIWPEEATELTFEDYVQLNLRMRRATTGINQMYLSFNPVDALHWIKREVEDKPSDKIAMHHSTYKDNPYASETDIEIIEDLINKDENFYKVYALGQWGILENIIYGKWETFKKVEIDPETKIKTIDGKKVDDITYGLDFGFSNPSVLTEINWIENDFITRELLYQSGLTNAELIERVKKLIPEEHRYREIYADHSEPARINEFYNADFNIHKAKKDVLAGIDYCKTHLLGVTADSINGIKELQSYKRREDKDGNVMEEPVKFNDHFCDSMRYGSYSKLNIIGDSKVADYSFR